MQLVANVLLLFLSICLNRSKDYSPRSFVGAMPRHATRTRGICGEIMNIKSIVAGALLALSLWPTSGNAVSAPEYFPPQFPTTQSYGSVTSCIEGKDAWCSPVLLPAGSCTQMISQATATYTVIEGICVDINFNHGAHMASLSCGARCE